VVDLMVGAEGFEPPALCSQSGITVFSPTYRKVPSFALTRIFGGCFEHSILETDTLNSTQFL